MAGRFRHLIPTTYSKSVSFYEILPCFVNEKLTPSLFVVWLKWIENVLSHTEYVYTRNWSKTQFSCTKIVLSSRCFSPRYFVAEKHHSVWEQYRDNRAWQRILTFARLSTLAGIPNGWRRKGKIGIRVPRTKRKGERLRRRKRGRSKRTRVYMSFFTTPYSRTLFKQRESRHS